MKRILPAIPAFLLCLWGGGALGELGAGGKAETSALAAAVLTQWPGGGAYQKELEASYEKWVEVCEGNAVSHEQYKGRENQKDIAEALFVKLDAAEKTARNVSEEKKNLINIQGTDRYKKLKEMQTSLEQLQTKKPDKNAPHVDRVQWFKNYKNKYDELDNAIEVNSNALKKLVDPLPQ